MSILCTICARGGSKGLSNKALRKINGKPLISFTIKQALKSKIFDEVIVSTLGFISSVNVISYLKATPHFVDCEEDTLGIDPIKLENYLKKNTFMKNTQCINKKNKKVIRAMIVTHMFGYPCKIDEIKKIAKEKNIFLIEDCAQSFDTYYNNIETGMFGDVGIYSCSLIKIPTTLSGGILITSNKEINNFIEE